MMRKLWLASALGAAALGCLVTAASAHARLDPSFGDNGVVRVQPPLSPPWKDQYIHQMVAARSGPIFALFERQYCLWGNCPSENALVEYDPKGALDSAFGGSDGAYELSQAGGEALPVLAVDSEGRPLLARTNGHRAIVQRLTSSGVLDPSFGADGEVAFECKCEWGATRLIPGPRGTLTVALPRSRQGRGPNGFGTTGTILRLIRLKANGSRDRRFGQGGSITFGLRGAGPFSAHAVSGKGALYLSGADCCGFGPPGYLVRVSARGRLDGRFTAASKQALRSLEALNSFNEAVNAVLVRRSGKIDLLGSLGYEKGFVLRLKPNGHRYRRFAEKGLRVLPRPVASAALGSDGAILAVSDENLEGGDIFMRILASGHMDPAFGRLGKSIPEASGDYGLSVVSQAGRRALVLDLGFKECRGYCPAEPKLVRFLEGPPPKRR